MQNIFSKLVLAFTLFVVACSSKKLEDRNALESNLVVYADLFSMYEHQDTFLINILENKKTIATYKFSKTELPKKRWIVLSSIFAGFLSELNARDLIVGLDDTRFINDSGLIQRIAEKKLIAVKSGSNLLREAILGLHADILVHSGFGELSEKDLTWLNSQGVVVLTCNNYLESNPLGRAEWVKLFGILANKKDEAFELFEKIAFEYEDIKSSNKSGLRVMAGALYSGVWDVPSGNSYIAQLIEDAGGDYVWKAFEGVGKKSLTLEQVLSDAKNAAIWINPGHFDSYDALIKSEKRYAFFKPYQQKRIFNNNLWINKHGGNAYWEKGAVRPDIILKDLKQIMKSYSDSGLTFYQELK
jgi:iron complex transport system substrate-binding protein